MQDLVYKSGQAGVTKATVSITFDNADKNQTPLGYEQYDEITVTRQVFSVLVIMVLASNFFVLICLKTFICSEIRENNESTWNILNVIVISREDNFP